MKGYGIHIKNDLLEQKHVIQMDSSLWLYMWLIDKMTSIGEDGIGKVLGGKPICYTEIKEELGISERKYNRWISKLRLSGYIFTKRAPNGLIIAVNKAFKTFGKKYSDTTNVAGRYAKSGGSDTTNVADAQDNTVDNTKTESDAKRHADPQDHQLAMKMISMIRENIPNVKQPDLSKWAEEFNRIRRLDKRIESDVMGVMTWALQDDFWSTNILSPVKLRKQFDRLTAQMNMQSKVKNKSDGYLHDGTHVVRRGGVWVLATDPGVRVDPTYYPEIAKDQVFETKEMALASKR